jgi:hypothetical protein
MQSREFTRYQWPAGIFPSNVAYLTAVTCVTYIRASKLMNVDVDEVVLASSTTPKSQVLQHPLVPTV